MKAGGLALTGAHIRLEPLERGHVDGLVAAAAQDPSLYQWSPAPQGKVETLRFVETARAWRDAGTAAPFAIVRVADGVTFGSTRFWNLERWPWHAYANACLRNMAGAPRFVSYGRTKQAFRRCAGTYWREVRRSAPGSSHGG
jgi:hypothetical protein